jgi:predicted Zn-ribbon and HTH transcriptional regulator
MAPVFADKIPKDIPSDCAKCGYLPRLDDVAVILPEFTGNEIVYHVRCYHCGHEWVD